MKAKDAKRAADLVEALGEIPRVRRRLKARPDGNHDAIALELAAADMHDGEGSGSSAFFYVPADLAAEILTAAEKVIRAELTYMGVSLK